ncbi:glycosyltransferase family 2 protein [Sphingomonas bacterium]|uniref:glycosyltransferase family 2 protein n=1 Tax=Sphingomonas bacterium TaxID=1895847 RepID=UPI001C2D41E7|nr:glycosyltransferase [Sphingomonas bacterium]
MTLLTAMHRSILSNLKLGKVRGNPKFYHLRDRGDAARDEREWAEAARHYRSYLKLAPRDQGIWVQLGHMLKEDGALDEALRIYQHALRLRASNADVLLSLGHIHKLRGNLAIAAYYYSRSLALDPDGRARTELALPAFAAFLTEGDKAIKARADELVMERLAQTCAGLKPIVTSDIAIEGDGFAMLSQDPFVQFEVLPHTPGIGGIGELTLSGRAELRFTEEGFRLQQVEKLYFDFGDGWSEDVSLTFRLGDPAEPDIRGDSRTLLIAGLKPGDRIRWDPDQNTGHLLDLTASYRAIENEANVRDRFAESAPRDIDRIIAEESFQKLIAQGPKAFRNPPAAAKSLNPSLFDLGQDYGAWVDRYMTLDEDDYRLIADRTETLGWKPTFSFVMPTYNTPGHLLRECIDSMQAQTYPHFEICIADDNSKNPEVFEILQEYAATDDRVKIVQRRLNGHISAASNSALALASGNFIVLMDHDDLIPDYTLFVVAEYLNRYPEAKILYSDEDKVRENGERFNPYFKGDFNRYLMFGHNMVSHLGVYERALVERIGGFRLGLEGSQDYDLLLRAYELIRDDQIVHIPHILYHWRAIAGSTAVSADQKSYAIERARDAINGHFERTGLPLRSVAGFAPGCTGVAPERELNTLVSIIIPTRNGLDVLKPCIESIDASFQHDFELLVVDNGSDESETLNYLKFLDARHDCRVLRDPRPFNFSEINNAAAEVARGEILCFLNNDTEVLEKKWLDRARGLLVIPEIGMVGARLLFEDGTLQHFGIGLGMAAHRVAGTLHSGFDGTVPGYFGKARLMQEFSAVTAACMFIRKADFEAVGGFDPEFRVAYNDVDLCLRVRQRGLKIVCDPDILLLHKESKTRGSDKRGERKDRLQAEADMMRERWAQVLDSDPYLSPNHAIDRTDFALAYPPRVPLPWREA